MRRIFAFSMTGLNKEYACLLLSRLYIESVVINIYHLVIIQGVKNHFLPIFEEFQTKFYAEAFEMFWREARKNSHRKYASGKTIAYFCVRR